MSFATGILVFARVGQLVQRTEAAVPGIGQGSSETATHLRAALHAELKQANTKRDNQNGKDRVHYHIYPGSKGSACNKAHASFEGKIIPCPFSENPKPVSEANQKKDMYE